MRHRLRLVTALAASLTAVACASGGSTGNVSGRMPGGAPGAMAEAPRRDSAIRRAEGPASDNTVTTVIVVRHAEKAAGEGDDPHLSEAGVARAPALAHALEDAGVTAVITTQFKTAESNGHARAIESRYGLATPVQGEGGVGVRVDETTVKRRLPAA